MRAVFAMSLLLVACVGSPGPTSTLNASPTAQQTQTRPPLRYVALGDSYTIGTGIAPNERWPDQLVERLREGGIEVALIANLGVNGYTSGDLIVGQLPELRGLRPDFVTLLIGVNDVVQRVPIDTYRANVVRALDELTEIVGRQRVVVVSTPDYTRTPRGADFGAVEQQRSQIALANAELRSIADQRGIAFVDISPVADRVGDEPSLVADDLLHPSSEQYAAWVELIEPIVVSLLSD